MGRRSITPQDVLQFWFSLPQKAYFTKDPALDADMKVRFSDGLAAARAGELDGWCDTLEGALALVILLDQFSRNIHRDTPEMFAGDAKALGIADKLLEDHATQRLPKDQLCWLVLPFMHSEELPDQERCVDLCQKYSLDNQMDYATDHADIIRKFGRFPHRNALLNRDSSAQEQEFLDSGGFAG